MIGIQTLPDSKTPYSFGMHGVVLILFCIVPMIAWLATLWAMKVTLNRSKDERDPGSQCSEKTRCKRRHDIGRCHGQMENL